MKKSTKPLRLSRETLSQLQLQQPQGGQYMPQEPWMPTYTCPSFCGCNL